MSTGDQPFLPQLISQMQAHFDEGETIALCLHFDLNYRDLPGQGNAAKIRELVLYLARRQQLAALIDLLRGERPSIPWPDIPPDFTPPAAPDSPTPPSPTQIIGQVTGSNVIVGGVQHIDQLNIETTAKPAQADPPTQAANEPAANPPPITARMEALVEVIHSLPHGSTSAKEDLANLVAEMGPLLAALPAQRAADAERVVKSLESLLHRLNDANLDPELIDMYSQGLQRSAARLADDQPALEPLVANILASIAPLLSG